MPPALSPGGARPLIPLALLILVEALSTALIAPLVEAQIGPVALLITGAVLLAGLAPALLRPSWVSARVGAFAVLLGSLIWQAATASIPTLPSFEVLAMVLPHPRPALGLANTVLMAPLVLHIAARFPRRSAITDGALVAVYGAAGALLGAILLAPAALRVPLIGLIAAGAYGALALAGWLLVRAIRDPRPEHRHQLAQARLIFVSFLLAAGPLIAIPIAQLAHAAIPYTLLLAAQVCFPIGIAYAILRHDLFGIDAALRRAMGYAGASLGFLAIAFGLTAALAVLLRELAPPYQRLATALSVLGAAAAFPWLQRQAWRLINRAFYPERLTFQRDLEAAQAQLERVVRRDEVAALLTDALPARLGAGWGRLHLEPAPAPPAPGAAWSAPLLVSGRRLGTYWLGPRRSGRPYAPDEQERLRALTQQAALALAYAETFEALAQLNEELEARVAARTEQLVAHQRELAALAERQRLARDLHDSLKQTLFSLGLSLHAIAGLAERSPDQARRLIEQQAEQVVRMQGDLAELLTELRAPPPAHGDLVAAIRAECERLEAQHGFRVALAAPPALHVAEPARSELAAVAREGLHNALKHSGAGAAELRLGAEGGLLCLTIADRGCGFDPAAAGRGHGLRGIEERMAALGGSLTVAATPGGGTTLWARIPWQAPSAS